MKEYSIGETQTIVLSQENLSENCSISLIIIGEDGNVLTNSSNNPIQNLPLTYNINSKLYQVVVTIHKDTVPQFIRLYFIGADVLPKYKPEDAVLIQTDSTKVGSEIVPVTYFEDYFLAVQSKLSPEYKKAVKIILDDRENTRRLLKSAEGNLELDLELYITERELVERRDNYFERFNMHLWQMQVFYPPINELVEVKIIYGQTEIAGIDKKLFTFDRKIGLIEFLPLPGGESAGIYNLLLRNISGFGFALINGGILDRIPNMFNITYKSGLYCSQTEPHEKEVIRRAIARRALIDIKQYIDPRNEEASQSESIDGVSSSKSFKIAEILKELREEEKVFVLNMKRKYAKTIDMVIA